MRRRCLVIFTRGWDGMMLLERSMRSLRLWNVRMRLSKGPGVTW